MGAREKLSLRGYRLGAAFQPPDIAVFNDGGREFSKSNAGDRARPFLRVGLRPKLTRRRATPCGVALLAARWPSAKAYAASRNPLRGRAPGGALAFGQSLRGVAQPLAGSRSWLAGIFGGSSRQGRVDPRWVISIHALEESAGIAPGNGSSQVPGTRQPSRSQERWLLLRLQVRARGVRLPAIRQAIALSV
jgi:hypothetical protein